MQIEIYSISQRFFFYTRKTLFGHPLSLKKIGSLSNTGSVRQKIGPKFSRPDGLMEK